MKTKQLFLPSADNKKVKRIFRNLSKLLIILAVLCITSSFFPKPAQSATYFNFGFGYQPSWWGRIRINVGSYPRYSWGYGYGWHYPRIYVGPRYYKSPRLPQLSYRKLQRLHDQTMRLLDYKLTTYFAQKAEQEQAHSIQENKLPEINMDPKDSPEIPQIDIQEPSEVPVPKEVRIADKGTIEIKLY